MIRVKPNRCGYSQYTCMGAPALDELYANYGLVCDTDVRERTDNFIVTDQTDVTRNYIDNYNNLPVKFKRFMMSQAYIHDFSAGDNGAHTKVPEVLCMTDINPFSEDGFIDAYNVYKSKTDCRAWPSAQYGLLSEVLPCCVATTDNAGIVTVEEGELEPGILEPIIDPIFYSGGWDPVPPPYDWEFPIIETIQEWGEEIDKAINDLNNRHTNLSSIRAIIANMQLRSVCKDQFVIRLTSGEPLQHRSGNSSPSPPSYSIGGGWVNINNMHCWVDGITGVRGPFYAYVCVYFSSKDPDGYYDISDATLRIRTSYDDNAEYCLGIGGVKLTTTDSYWLYEIVQERCTFMGTVIKADEGVLWYDGHNNLKAYKVAECSDNS